MVVFVPGCESSCEVEDAVIFSFCGFVEEGCAVRVVLCPVVEELLVEVGCVEVRMVGLEGEEVVLEFLDFGS